MRESLYLIFAIILTVEAGNQCNLGHKLYSVESGNTICAPLAPFKCTHSCQWNTSCGNSAHSVAFQGRRTFVAGMILTDTKFLLLCCATLSQVVQQNQRLENRCVWVPSTTTVEHNPSLRFDPPLSVNEYVREMTINRLGNGQVEVKSQICKFTTQRTTCDEATMTEQEKQAYSILQLRLSRTESFFKDHNGTDPRDFFDLPILPPQENAVTNNQASKKIVPQRQQPPRQMSTATLLQQDAVETNIHSKPNQQFSIPFAQPPPESFQSNFLPVRVQPIQAFVTEGNQIGQSSNILNRRPAFRTRQGFPVNNQANLSPRHVPSLRPGRLNGVAQLHTNNIHSGEFEDDDRKQRFEFPASDAFLAFSGTQQNKRPVPSQRFILSTNQTYEIAHKYRRASAAANRLLHQHNLYKPPHHYNSADTSQIEERPFKSALAIRKLHLGTAKRNGDIRDDSGEATSYGGSFASTEFAASTRNLRTFNNLHPFSAHKFPEENDVSPVQLPHGLVHQPRPAASLIFQPAQRTLVHELGKDELKGIYRTAHATYQPTKEVSESSYFKHDPTPNRFHGHSTPSLLTIPPTVKPVAAPPSDLFEQAKQESLKNLLDCCQQQAPGCRHLCSPSINKEQIKRAIQTNECPPLSMTSVLQCFPRFYNISQVGQCCEQASQIPTPSPSSVNSLLSNFTPSPRLPGQCQNLCEPNFKLSFSHFACVDHISTIVDCYRDLLVR